MRVVKDLSARGKQHTCAWLRGALRSHHKYIHIYIYISIICIKLYIYIHIIFKHIYICIYIHIMCIYIYTIYAYIIQLQYISYRYPYFCSPTSASIPAAMATSPELSRWIWRTTLSWLSKAAQRLPEIHGQRMLYDVFGIYIYIYDIYIY